MDLGTGRWYDGETRIKASAILPEAVDGEKAMDWVDWGAGRTA